MKSSELVLNEREVRQRQCSGPFLIKNAKRAGLAILFDFLGERRAARPREYARCSAMF